MLLASEGDEVAKVPEVHTRGLARRLDLCKPILLK
jgi:hypothetical protein